LSVVRGDCAPRDVGLEGIERIRQRRQGQFHTDSTGRD
jgi:hypothetical protein